MGHKAVRQFIQDIAESLRDDVKFGYGRASDFNQIKDKQYPYIWLDPLTSSLTTMEDNIGFFETYTINLSFYKFDEMDSTEEQYKLILDDVDDLVQRFIRKIQEDNTDDYDTPLKLTTWNTRIENINKQPFIKVMADVLTGFILTFDFTVPDQFDYCNDN
jgi:hypothetical protein